MQEMAQQSVEGNQPINRATLTVEEAGRLLGIGRAVAYESARRGDIPTLRLGRRIVVPKAALERLLANGQSHDHVEGAA